MGIRVEGFLENRFVSVRTDKTVEFFFRCGIRDTNFNFVPVGQTISATTRILEIIIQTRVVNEPTRAQIIC